MGNRQKTGRNSSIELLRILCLVMIFWMHSAGSYKDNELSAWISIAVSVVGNIGVSVFILISGYYGIRLNIKKMLQLDLMIIFYSWFALFLQFVWGNSVGGEELLSYLCPVIGKRSWYFTCYFALAFLSPFLNEMVETLGELRLRQLILTMLVIFSGITTVFFFDMNGDGGKGIVQMVMLYLMGRYLAVYQQGRRIPNAKLLKLLALCISINFCLNGALYVLTGTVQNRYARDNSLFTIIQAVCVFLIFSNMHFEHGLINEAAKHVPAAFLFEWTLREVITRYFVDYVQYKKMDSYQLILFAMAIAVTAMGMAADWLRVKLLAKPEHWLAEKIYAAGEKLWIRVCRFAKEKPVGE